MTDEDLKIATTRPFRWPGSAKSASDATAGLPKSRKSASLSIGKAGIRRMSGIISPWVRGAVKGNFSRIVQLRKHYPIEKQRFSIRVVKHNATFGARHREGVSSILGV